MNWLGIDIGGANLKIADGDGFAVSRPFALWQQPDGLTQQLRTLIDQAPPTDRLAITMTGELADCYATKSDGVRAIIRAAQAAGGNRRIRVYLLDGRLVPAVIANDNPYLAAASNWHVLARYVGRYAGSGPGLMIDVGSTTTDIIPLIDGQPAVDRPDDTSRLIQGQLVYTGVERSPVCAVADAIPYRGASCPLAQELFATMRDVYLVLGELCEDARDTNTADGRAATIRAARARLARSICADRRTFDQRDAAAAARHLADRQYQRVAAAVEQVIGHMPGYPTTVVVCGQGQFLARRTISRVCPSSPVAELDQLAGPAASTCGPAHALAIVAREEDRGG